MNTEPGPVVFCPDTAVHLLRQEFCDGKAKTCGVSGIFNRIKTVKEFSDLYFIQARCSIGEYDLAVILHGDGKIAVAVFQGIVQYIAEYPGEGDFI